MAREYILKRLPPSEAVVEFELVGGALKRVKGGVTRRHGNASREGGTLPKGGRQKGAKAKGWTAATRAKNREHLEEHRSDFVSMAHLRFRDDPFHDAERLREVRDKFFRWLRKQRPKVGWDYHWVMEFAERSTDPHFHVCFTVAPSDELKNKMERYWTKISGGGTLVWESRVGDKVDAIARYAAKSRQKTNPDWFKSGAFRPYGNSFAKTERERVAVSLGEAERAGLMRHKLTYDGVAKVAEAGVKVSPLSGGGGEAEAGEVSPLSNIHEAPDNDGTLKPYVAPTQASLMAKACRYCYYARCVYMSRVNGATTCDNCGRAWEPATLGRLPKRTVQTPQNRTAAPIRGI